MRLFLSSKRSDDYSLRIRISGPFQREVRVNFIRDGLKTIIIPTGRWIKELEIFPYVILDSTHMKASFERTERYRDAFVDKYGKEHFERYFLGYDKVAVLEPSSEETADDLEVLGTVFDIDVDQYLATVDSNWVQRYMREMTLKVLNSFVEDGNKILDLGCGPKSEVLEIAKKVRVTEADISNSTLKKSISIHQDNLESVDWLLLRDAQDIHGLYDVVFSSYGYLNIAKPSKLVGILNDNLKLGGYFIGSYMNRYGLLDILLSLFKGRIEYIRERMGGTLTVNHSRFNTLSYPRKPSFLGKLNGLDNLYKKGVCNIIPPYNYHRLTDPITKTSSLRRIDELVGTLPLLYAGADYIIFVFQKNGFVAESPLDDECNKGY
jgi:SAM-dependent methyltransferase